MSDDSLKTYASRFRAATESRPAPAPMPTLPPSIAYPHADGRQAYEAYGAFDAQVRATSVEVRCHRTGLSHFFEYAAIGVPVFNFRTGRELFFTGGGYSVTIIGWNLYGIVLAMRLHSCSTIQDFSPDTHILPEPVDRSVPFIESIEVKALRPPKPDDVSATASPDKS